MTKRLKQKGTQVTPNPHTGVTREHYDKIVDIANECDMKIIDVMTYLLNLGLKQVEVVEVNVPVKKLRRKNK